MLFSIPHHYTYMIKKSVQQVGFAQQTNTDTRNLHCSTKNKRTCFFNVGFNPTSLYILIRQRSAMLGLHDKPTLRLKSLTLASMLTQIFECWLQCPMYQKKKSNKKLNVRNITIHEKERCSMLGLHDKPTLTPKVYNSGFRELSMLASMLHQNKQH